MKVFPALLAVAAAIILAACGSHSKTATLPVDSTAVTAAQAWLALADEGKYPETWSAASSFFQKALPQEKWVETLGGLRPAFGKTLSRQLASAQSAASLPGAPDGKYTVMQFNTKFEKKENAVETVTFMQDTDGAWRAAGYFIK
jgi:hypothetical protein